MRPLLLPIFSFIAITALCSLALTGCKKFADIPAVIETYTPDSIIQAQPNNGKVLLISIDGLKGDYLSANLPPNVSNVLAHSKYMFVPHPGSYFPINNTSSWGSMLTGNSETRLWDSSFFAVPDTTLYVPVPPNLSVARYIKNYDHELLVAAISPWQSLVNNLLSDADKKRVTTGDDETKIETVNSLATDNAVLTVVQFTGVQKAGLQNGFGSAAYKAALQQVDVYIGEIMAALEGRQNYANERWLTLITTAQVRYPRMTALNYLASGQYIPEFTIAHSKNFTRQNMNELRPPLYIKREDMTANILYWLKITNAIGIRNSVPWLNNFELEAQQ